MLFFFLLQSDKDTVDAYIDLALGLNGASWSLPILRNSSATSNLDLQKSFTDALVQLKVKEISAQVTSCRRCVCASDATGRRVKPKCDITEDQAFCRCEATGNQMVCVTISSDTFVLHFYFLKVCSNHFCDTWCGSSHCIDPTPNGSYQCSSHCIDPTPNGS